MKRKIYSIGEDMSLESGGQRTAITSLHNYINKNDTNLSSTIITNKKESDDNFIEFKPDRFSIWNYSKDLKRFLNEHIKEIDLFHLHGAWMHPQFISSKVASKNDVPYIMTLHGMLEPWYLKQKQLKKKLYLELILAKILANSNIIHAITPFEKDNLYKLTNHKNIIEIPNLIHYSKIPNFEYNPSEEYFLFLSRLHPGKGMDILIESMLNISDKKIMLKIVGTENDYSQSLKKKIISLGLENRIEFLGSVFGDKKFELFANAKAFVAPSYSEAIGMVNLEAAICKTPVITTFNTGIKPTWNDNGGIMIQPTVTDLTIAMNEALSWGKLERNERGKNLHEFVIKNYSWEENGKLWVELYNSIKKG